MCLVRCPPEPALTLALSSNSDSASLLSQVLLDWINDVLAEERIIVKQLEEDLYDGQVLQKLLGECQDPAM